MTSLETVASVSMCGTRGYGRRIMLMKWLIQIVLWQGVMAILLFVPAGTINWTGAWIFLIETFVVSVVLGLWLARHDPALLKERLRSPIQKGQSIQDKIVTGVLVLLFFGWFAFMALDAIRFKWSSVPAWLQGPGALGVLVACYIGYLTLRENTFAAPVVKIQKERVQKRGCNGDSRKRSGVVSNLLPGSSYHRNK